MDSIIYLRIKTLCEKKGITILQLQSNLGFGASTIKTWKNGIAPSADKILKVAKHFNVSTDYLLGATDISTPLEEFIADDDIISLQRAKAQMSVPEKRRMMNMLRAAFDFAFEDNYDSHDK